jgi:hypothetical protein
MGRSFEAGFSVIGQFDLSGDDALHSQYFAGKMGVPFGAFAFTLGGCFELIESNKTETAFAAEAGLSFVPPTRLRNQISVLGRYASGASGGGMAAFSPFTIKSQGDILGAKLSGLSVIIFDYVARVHQALSLGVRSSYFVRNDLTTYRAYPLSEKKSNGHLLGNEFYGRLLFSPFSDLQLNLGGGVFLPSMGDAAPNADSAWRIELNVIFSM